MVVKILIKLKIQYANLQKCLDWIHQNRLKTQILLIFFIILLLMTLAANLPSILSFLIVKFISLNFKVEFSTWLFSCHLICDLSKCIQLNQEPKNRKILFETMVLNKTVTKSKKFFLLLECWSKMLFLLRLFSSKECLLL